MRADCRGNIGKSVVQVTVDALLGYLPADLYDALGQLWPAGAAGLVLGVTVWLVACAVRVGFDVMGA